MERDGTNYFEKICLRGNIDKCRDKVWAFERVPGRQLEGFDDKIIDQVRQRVYVYRNIVLKNTECSEQCRHTWLGLM